MIDWLARAHHAGDTLQRGISARGADAYAELFRRVGCRPEQIGTRGMEADDFVEHDFERMTLTRFHESPTGAPTSERMRAYTAATDRAFGELYPNDAAAPDQIVHVTCTGYESPSAAQRAITRRGWGPKTSALHAYHMGCYAAFPAVNMAAGGLARARQASHTIDIVHTELCSLHLTVAAHTVEQLVIQSLFADGFIKYSMSDAETASTQRPGLALLATREEIVGDTSGAMTWVISDHGMRMSLAKDVPGLIAIHVPAFCEQLCADAGVRFADVRQRAVFAVHPGGPKILTGVGELLSLEAAQIAHSRAALHAYGNMSSATVPHIWSAILEDASIGDGTPVISLAFGPGLSIFGTFLQVRKPQ